MTTPDSSGTAGFAADARGGLERLQPWLPPLGRREFWAVQLLVLLIAGAHTLLETTWRAADPSALYLLPASLYFVPVVYAAVNFGLQGSLSTAVWSVVVTLPNILVWHTGLERAGEAWQIGIVVALAVFVGERVDRERGARREAERREAERRTSEERYRGLFDNAPEAVLLIERSGVIAEANAAAAQLLRRSPAGLRGSSLAALAGTGLMEQLNANAPRDVVPLPFGAAGRPIWVEPIVCSPHAHGDGIPQLQVMLHDVTLRYQRQQDLEEYTRRILAAREEERRRIGRELHDGPVQSLVVIWRKLDDLQAAGDEHSRAVAGDARDLTDAAVDELRRIARALRPSVLDDLGLAAALESEASSLEQRSAMSVRFECVGTVRHLEPDTEVTLLRIAQEALHNAERHAAASHVRVRLAYDPGAVRLLVRDDGRGLGALPSASDLLASGKLGIVGMRERARLAGADFRARSLPRGGTSIEMSVPT